MPNSTDAIAILNQVHLGFGKRQVLSDLTLEIHTGEVLTILGRVGAGKTQILRLLAGLVIPQAGSVAYTPKLESQNVGMIFQNDLLLPWLSVGENLAIVKRPETSDTAVHAGRHFAIDAFDAPAFMSRMPRELSGGMRQRVNLARGFINGDPLVLMDEPFSVFDPAEKHVLLKAFLKLQNTTRVTTVMVTHDIREALAVSNRIAYLSSQTRQISEIYDNPFRGELNEVELFAHADYRLLHQALTLLYHQESPTQ